MSSWSFSLLFFVVLFAILARRLQTPYPIVLVVAEAPDCEESEARALMLKAAIEHSEKKRTLDHQDFAAAYKEMLKLYRQRLEGAEHNCAAPHRSAALARRIDLIRELARVERQTVIHLRNHGRISDDVLRQLEDELDLTETKYALASQRMKTT